MSRKKLTITLVVPVLLIVVGLWQAAQIVAQVAPGEMFAPVRTIGQSRPSGLRYDPNFDRFLWVDDQGQLVIVAAATLEPLHVLYTNGAYNAFTFSRDGRTIAVAFGTRVDIWDSASGTRVATFAPTGAIRVQGPLQFTRNDELLAFDTVVPAPQELRRSENDTVILPWVWDIAAARDQRNSVLVNRVAAYPFYNVRVSMVAGDNGILVSGIDQRIQVYDADTPTMALIADLPADRLETTAISAWRSATDPYLYVSLDQSGTMAQINTSTNAVNILELGHDLNLKLLDNLQNFSLSRVHQSIGGATNQTNPLAQLLLGSDYVAHNGYKPTSLDLLDVLIPVTDDPTQDIATNTNLLIYNYNDQTRSGYVDLAHPGSIAQIAFTPKTNQLALRQSSKGQIELYNVATGALERIITPIEPDPGGTQTLAYTGDGYTLLSDFERFDPATGALLARAPEYTQTFGDYFFTDNDRLITLGGTPLRSNAPTPLTWRMWDIDSGELLRADTIPLNDQGVLNASSDNLRYLTQTTAPDGSLDLTIVDGRADETQTIHIPVPPDQTVQNVIANATWTRFLIVYSASDPSGSDAVYPVAVYDRSGRQLYFDAGNNLPTDPINYEWRDDRTIAIEAYPEGGLPLQPITGLNYHPSGLPQCVVDALPENWQSLVPVWEWVVYNYPRDRVNATAQQMCTALTGDSAHSVGAAEGTPAIAANPTEIVGLLTPSPTSVYLSARTPAPIAVPGVPTCITNRFQRDAVAYAAVWRQMTAGITDPAKLAELQTMICQGLLSNFGGLQPTPTTDPNSLAVVTATPLPNAPQTTGGDQYGYDVMTIDIETGARTFATGVVDPPVTPQPDALRLLSDLFNQQYRFRPNQPVLSPDGQYMAAQSDRGYVTIYRLSRPVSELVQDQLASATPTPRSLGLAPTSTPPPQALDAALPTLTPTITLTPIPFTQADANLAQWNDTEAICPAPRLYTLPDLPANFSPPGTLLVSPFDTSVNGGLIWTLDPHSGSLVGNDTLPKCGVSETCSNSPDGKWIVRQQVAADGGAGDVIVSRIDGSEPVTLYTAAEIRVSNPYFSWQAPHTLHIDYRGVLPTFSPELISLNRTYDPETGIRSAGALDPTPVPLGLLPFDTVSKQPNGTLELLAENAPSGTRFYLRDTATGQSELLAQGSLYAEWQPAGRFLYYAANRTVYLYDTLTHQSGKLGVTIPGGTWSPDGHLRADWTNISGSDAIKQFAQGQLPPRLQVWDADTGLLRTYCIPELSNRDPSGVPIFWSPDSRYLAFVLTLPVGGDIVPTPTFAVSPETPPATNTPIPIQTQYEYQFPRTIVLDTTTGNAVILSTEASAITEWIEK